MTGQQLGPLIVLAGVALVIIGLLVWAGGFAWFGKLPGDIRIDRENVHIFIPLTSMLVLSVAFSLLLSLGRRIF